jgi:TPR repeat protein
MGVCHEEGRGVVAADAREAVKFFRKAQKLGHPGAAEKVEQMESLLKARSEEI